MVTPVGQCLCGSVSARDGCGLCQRRSVSSTDEAKRELCWQSRQGRCWEFEEKKGNEIISGDVCINREVAACLLCLSFESAVHCRCTCLSPLTTSSFSKGIEFDDEVMKKVRRLKQGVKLKTHLLRQKRVPKGATHLRNGQLPRRGAQLRSGWVSKGVAPSRNGSVSRGLAHLKINGRVPTGIALLRKKNYMEINGNACLSGVGPNPDPADSPDVVVNNLPALEIIDATEAAASTELPYPVDVEVVAEEAVLLGDDGEVVEDVVITEETVGRGENGVDKDVARSTVDLGVAGDPIVLGLLSQAVYADLVFNVVQAIFL